MKAVLLLAAIASLISSVFAPTKSRVSRPTGSVLVVGGSVHGYLAPCGCSKPMSGGIKRWVAAVRTLQKAAQVSAIVNGGFVAGVGRQNELKAETLAQAYKSAGVAAVNLTTAESALGLGQVSALDRLCGETFTSLVLGSSETLSTKAFVQTGAFLVTGVEPEAGKLAAELGESSVGLDSNIKSFLQEAKDSKLVSIVMLASGLEDAKSLARRFPEIRAIVYESSSPPVGTYETEGQTILLTPGEKGRHLVSVEWNGKNFEGYRATLLGPEVADDPEVTELNHDYLHSVDSENLLDMAPRLAGQEYVGSEPCLSCHPAAAKAWKSSMHYQALKTLEDVQHDRDPDCVSCHVVGLESQTGFRSRDLTPLLSDVGCESCHGAGKAHVADPKTKMGQAGSASCAKCHNLDHSPKFDFDKYWDIIRH